MVKVKYKRHKPIRLAFYDGYEWNEKNNFEVEVSDKRVLSLLEKNPDFEIVKDKKDKKRGD